MQAKIRYGNEADILEEITSHSPGFNIKNPDYDFEALRADGIMALTFSTSLNKVPDLPAFNNVLEILGIMSNRLPNLGQNDPNDHILPATLKTIEIVNSSEMGVVKICALAKGLFQLVDDYCLDDDGIVFIDHTVFPAGDVIASHS